MATRNPVILNKPEDWPIWIEEIRGSIHDDIWSLIDPDLDDHEEFMRKPTKPRTQEINASKTRYLELTAAERNLFDQIFKHYQVFLKEYEHQTKGLQDAKDLIRSRVSDAKSVLLKGKDTARTWLAILKNATSASKGFISHQTAQKYEAAIRKAPTASTIDKWLSTWEQAMVDAIEHGIPEISSGRWLRDLARVIRPLSDALYVKFMSAASNDEKSRTERYLEIGIKIREVIQGDTPKKRVTRGAAFAAEFDGEPATDEDGHEEGDKSSKSRKRAGSTSMSNAPKSKKRKAPCKVCGQLSHVLPRCYYAFPELRHSGFKPVKTLVEKAAQAMEDSNLADEVEAIRREKQSKEDRGQ
jgi:hypothetical protein